MVFSQVRSNSGYGGISRNCSFAAFGLAFKTIIAHEGNSHQNCQNCKEEEEEEEGLKAGELQ